MDEQINAIMTAVKIAIDNMPEGKEFNGWELKREVVKLYPHARRCYVDTVLRCARKARRDNLLCINRRESLYRKVIN